MENQIYAFNLFDLQDNMCPKRPQKGLSNVCIAPITQTLFLIYCQDQPQSQLSWAELALVLIAPAAYLPGHPD